jgi:hypothetical protein
MAGDPVLPALPAINDFTTFAAIAGCPAFAEHDGF